MSDLATSRRIFRAAPLDSLSSPEQLDELIPITRPSAWIAMAALWLVVIAMVAWAVVGQIPTRVAAQGIILGEPVMDVTPAWAGQVTAVHVHVGDTLAAGQVIATVDQPELAIQIRQQQARMADLQTALRQRTAAAESTIVVQRRYHAQQRGSLEASAHEQDLVVRTLQTRATDERGLLDKGLISREAFLQTQQLLNAATEALARTRGALIQLGVSLLNVEASARETFTTATTATSEAQRELQRLEQDHARRRDVRTHVPGIVLERLVDAGDMLAPGQPIAKLLRGTGQSPRLRVLLYVRGEEGKRVRAGMDVRVAPSSVRAEEHGFLVATVRSITALPASPQAIRQALRNDALVATVTALSQPFQIEAEFAVDSTTPSGYRWTSNPGPPLIIEPGTPARAQVVVDRRRPIELVLPMLRRTFNLQ